MHLPFKLKQQFNIIFSWLLLAALTTLLLSAGFFETAIHEGLANFYHLLLSYLKFPYIIYSPIGDQYQSEVTDIGRILTKTSLIGIYCGISLLIIHLYFLNKAITKIVLWLYILMAAAFSFFFLTSQWLNNETSLIIASKIENILASPVKIILLIPALHLATPAKN